ILKKFDFASVKTASTPIETQKPLVKDEEATDVDVHLYRSMIDSLMYLTASRPDIIFAVCACSRVSSFDLEAYSDSDYAGANLDRKYTTGEAEYVAAANCCGQVLWIKNQMLDYGFNFMNTKIYIDNESTICIVKNPVFHSKTKHIEIRHHFIRDAYEKNLIQVLKIHTDGNVGDLLTKAFDVSRHQELASPEQTASGFCDKHNMVAFLQKPPGSEEFHQIVDFLASSHIRYALTANPMNLFDGHKFAITEASVRRYFQLADADGISSLPNTEIFEQLSLMGVTNLETKLKKTKEVHGKALTKLVKKGRIEETEYADVKEETEYVEEENAGVEYDFDLTEQQVTPLKAPQIEVQSQETFKAELRVLSASEAQLIVLSAAKILADASRERVKTYTRRRRSIDSSRDSTAGGLFSTAEGVQGKEQISTDEKVSQKLNNEEMARAAAREEQERTNFEKALELQKTDTEVEKTKTKRNAEETLLQESFKKLRAAEASRSEPIQEQPTEEPKELSEEELKKMLEIVPVEEIKAEALQAYQVFEDMLKGFDREDLVTLWSLVKERFRSVEPTKYKERALWVELKRLFKLDNDDVLWKLQRYMYDPLT
ncbi:hypothetical protein Tco_1198422, partial [Tanacetum coccineum]